MRDLQKGVNTYLGWVIFRGSLCLLTDWTLARGNRLLNFFSYSASSSVNRVSLSIRIQLAENQDPWHSGLVKLWLILLLLLLLAGGGAYLYFHRDDLGIRSTNPVFEPASTSSVAPQPEPVHLNWQTVDRPADGFTLEMPGEPQNSQAPAFNETGGTDTVHMLVANPSSQLVFAITWEDNPPVVRVNRDAPDSTLDMARDGMLGRTQTILDTEKPSLIAGFPAREISAHNNGGGVLDARLILVGDRLYCLMALSPSASARQPQEILRFFNGFSPSRLPPRTAQ